MLLTLTLWAASSAVAVAPPSYTYREKKLELHLPGLDPKTAYEVVWRGLNRYGQPAGKSQTLAVEVVRPDGRIVIDVGLGGGHDVLVRSKTTERRIVATRGTWFVLPRDNELGQSRTPSEKAGALVSKTDVVLAAPFRGEISTVKQRGGLELGRTLGLDLGAAVRPPKKSGLVIVGGSTRQGALITLTERLPKGKNRYWDHPLNFKRKTSRHVIPFDRFKPRDGARAKLRKVEAITIRALAPAKAGDATWIDFLGISRRVPRLGRVSRVRNGINVRILDRHPVAPARIHVRGAKTSTSINVTRSTMRLRGEAFAQAESAWLCHETADGISSCDPADAPVTAVALPVTKGMSKRVDTFPGSTPLNSLLLPTQVYTSTIGYDATRVSGRVPGSISLYDPDREGLKYVGYWTGLDNIPRHLRHLELEVTGRGPAERVKVGLRNRRKREPKIVLPEALSGERQTIKIPISAFGIRGSRYRAITVTLESDPEPQSLTIHRVALVP